MSGPVVIGPAVTISNGFADAGVNLTRPIRPGVPYSGDIPPQDAARGDDGG